MLAGVCGLIAGRLLPPAPAYVDSFGPFYLELGPITSARNHRPNAVRRARDILETMAGLSPATGGITDGRASITLASSSKLKAPTGLSVSDTGRGFSSALLWEDRLRTCLPPYPVPVITRYNNFNIKTAVERRWHYNN
ncbi:MAG: hypothetical protein L0Y75_07760 [Acidobacteria bacterium]|nr:hypothetical protein [Acidobacteriota bacterium]